jgi:myo-inositol-1(or 4)-monophosphatase
LLAFAHLLADRSAAAILPHFRKPITVSNKAAGRAFDPVTAADRSAEEVISRLIARHWPDHGIVGEEYGARSQHSRFRWIVDPIDGTRAFIMGAPLWGTLIGLLDGDKPILGLMNQPFTGERYWSSLRGAHLRLGDGPARRLKTRKCTRLAEAVFTTTDPELFEAGTEAAGFARLKSRVRMLRYGGDCYTYCLLAAGFVDLVVETGLKSHDIVALIPIIERAGGRITAWDGSPASGGGRIIAAGDPRLHDEALRLLSG